jgi:hypothetical protein
MTIGKDHSLKITDLGYQKTHTDVAIGSHELTYMLYDSETQRIFIGNGAGVLYIFGTEGKSPILLKEVNLENTSIIKGLTFDSTKSFIFSCKS